MTWHRIRDVLGDIRAEYEGEHVWIFSHQAVIMAFRLVLESLDEESVLKVDSEQPLPNVSLTSYRRNKDGALKLVGYASTTHLEISTAEPTTETPAGEGKA